MRSTPRTALLILLTLASPIAGRGPDAHAEPPPPQAPAVELQGIGRGILLRLEPNFRWKAKDEARSGVLGTLAGTTREFESIEIQLGADRAVLLAPQRSAYEAYGIQREVERGVSQVADVKPDLCLVRRRSLFGDSVVAVAVKQVGRTVVFARGDCGKKDEAGLVKLLKSVVGGASATGDDIDGWIPQEVKTAWTHTPASDLVVVEDGTVDAARRDEILKAVRVGHGAAKRLLSASWNTPFAPVVRITANRDLFAHLAARRDLRDADAAYVPYAAELLVSPRGPVPDAARIAQEAAAQGMHYALGAADSEPVLSGIARQAAAQASGVAAGGLLPDDEERALARVKGKQAKSWYRLLMMPTLVHFLSEDPEDRALDAELAVVYLGSSAATVGRTGLTAWIAAFRKVGHPDAASEAAVAAMDPARCEPEYWAYWGPRADPPKKPGDKTGGTPPKPATKPAAK